MPSDRKQLNVRLSDAEFSLLASLAERMRQHLGIPVSQSDVIRAGLLELDRKYPPLPDDPKKKKDGKK